MLTPQTTYTDNSSSRKIPRKISISILIVLLFAGTNIGSYFVGKRSVLSDLQNEDKSKKLELVSANNLSKISPTPRAIDDSKKESSPTPLPRLTTKILISDKELDGYVTSNEEIFVSSTINVGRNQSDVKRGFISFDLSSLPGGITVKAASLKINQIKTIGTPYTTNGELRIDHLNYGNSLDSNDYSIPALIVNLATLSTSKRLGTKSIDVTSSVKDDIANARSSTQFRIHAAKELLGGDLAGDISVLQSSDLGQEVSKPQLIIDYY